MPHHNYCVYIFKARWLQPAFAESYRLWRVTLPKELAGVHVCNASDRWHNWRVAGVRATTPVKLNVKTGPLPSLHLVLIFLGFQSIVVFLRFSECFPVISCFCIAVQIPDLLFSQLFSKTLSVSQWAPVSQVSPCSNLYVTAPDQSKVELQIIDMCRASSSILQ